MKILIAEDEKDMSKAICAILNHQGYETHADFDGLEALERAQEHTYCNLPQERNPGYKLLHAAITL